MQQHISSYWEYHLQHGGGFERLSRSPHIGHGLLSKLERWSYNSTQLQSLANFAELEGQMRGLLGKVRAKPNFLSFRTTCAAAVLISNWTPPNRFLVIGDGEGLMGAFMKWMFPKIEVFSVDLPPMLNLQKELYCELSLKGTFLEPSQLELIQSTDCAFNMASMQEMRMEEIGRYFAFLRSCSALFYCVNREEKRLIGGEILRFKEYPWSEQDSVLVDEPCWYYTHFFSHYPPLFHRFDGAIRHRLARLG
jgi:hypothetical protein